ncbi:Hypothetical predicted protein [Paramuricea clavata]|nr:Hypothetical predicted protein [Paramuricea clavata]
MSLPTWIIISTSLACFTAVFMITTFCVLARAVRGYKELGTGSPFKLTYSKRKPSTRNDNLHKSLASSRACSLKSLHAYESNLAIEAERDSRHIFERSSAFEYWWDDNNKFTTPKPSGRFHTIPMFYHGGRKEFGKAGNSGNGLEKMSNVDRMSRQNAASWAGNIDRTGYDAVNPEDNNKPTGDLKL